MASVEFVERTSMYKCDYEHLTLMGTTPLFKKAPSPAELDKLQTILEDCSMHLERENPWPLVQEASRAFIDDLWIFRFEECCTEARGVALSDCVFVAHCHLVCCEFPRCKEMSVLNDIHELYVRLQLLGTNHTRRRFDQEDVHMDVLALEKRVASLVVYHLSDSEEELLKVMDGVPLPAIDEVLRAEVLPLRMVEDIIKPTEDELRIAAEKAASDALKLRIENSGIEVSYGEITEEEAKSNETVYDVNEGAYWHSDKNTVIRGFIAFASRILRNYWLQKKIFDKYPVCEESEIPVYPESCKTNFDAWLHNACNTEAGDDNLKTFRELVFEHWIPLGSRQALLRHGATMHEILAPLNLMENQLGVDSATSLANMSRVKIKLIAKDPENEVYDFLCLSQFMYLMKHMTGVDFKKLYYIMPGDLGKLYKRLECETTWGRPRRPIFLRIQRGWWIHDAGKWIPCKDVPDAELKLMALWKQKYESKFANETNLDPWIKEVTSERNDDDYMGY